MTKPSVFFIGLAVGLLLGAGAGGAIAWKVFKCPDVAQPPLPPEYRDIQVPKTPEEKDKAIAADIKIIAQQRSNFFNVLCTNGYKSTEQKIPLVFPKPPTYHHTIQLLYMPVYNIEAKQFRHGIDFIYSYSWGHVGLAGGVMIVFRDNTLYDVAPKIGIQLRI